MFQLYHLTYQWWICDTYLKRKTFKILLKGGDNSFPASHCSLFYHRTYVHRKLPLKVLHVVDMCFFLQVAENGILCLSICPVRGLSSQNYRCAECRSPISFSKYSKTSKRPTSQERRTKWSFHTGILLMKVQITQKALG